MSTLHDILVAVHESAHAVIALRQGRAVRYVTLRPRSRGFAGLCKWRLRRRWWEYDLEAEVRMLLAGHIAEGVIVGYHTGGNEDDHTKAHAHIRELAWQITTDRAQAEMPISSPPRDLSMPAERATYAAWHRHERRQSQLFTRIELRTRVKLRRRLRREARDLVERNLGAIVAVADALLVRRTLSGREVKAIIADGRLHRRPLTAPAVAED